MARHAVKMSQEDFEELLIKWAKSQYDDGGDWEDPVYFVLYPETATTIRAYMPKDGNTWDIKSKSAWGSHYDENDDDFDPDENPRKVDVVAFRADVEKRLTAKEH